jgi:GWxTD domain-containing protein
MTSYTLHHIRILQKAALVVMLGLCIVNGVSALEADVRIARFQAQEKSYIEMFIYVLGSSVTSNQRDSHFHASVAVTYFITRNGEVVAGDKLNLLSAGDLGIPDFMDLRRMALSPGSYELSVELSDNLDTANAVTLSQQFTIDPHSSTPGQSDIQLMSNVVASQESGVWIRNGMQMTPLPYAWYRADLNNLYFYHELYHTDVKPADDFYISYSIAPEFDQEQYLLEGYKRLKPKAVNSIVQGVDITGLTSGEYILEIRVFDQSKTLLSSRSRTFSRSNPEADKRMAEQMDQFFSHSFTLGMSEDSVRYALRAIAPVVAQQQVPVLNSLLQKGEMDHLRRFLHRYWVEKNPHKPVQAYSTYMQMVAIVDKEYHSAFGYGFETDRGRTILKYGMPGDMIGVNDEPSAPPYEIWIYNEFPVTGQSNVRFLFYNPSLAGGDYRLLHSTATGELQNSRWQQQLYSDALSESGPGDLIDARGVQDNFHRRAVEYFND